jgi:hypothetical protein
VGAYYNIEADFKVPLEKAADLGLALQAALYTQNEPGPDNLVDVLDHEFQDANLEYNIDTIMQLLEVTGSASGDFSYTGFSMLINALEPFVVGVLDYQEDSSDWNRIRYRNGKMVEHAGETIFPTDTDPGPEVYRTMTK